MINPFRQASYVLSAHRLNQLPEDSGIEVAIAGRSNAGKSSAINALTDQKSLARTSKTPGRTQQIVIFRVDDQRRIALLMRKIRVEIAIPALLFIVMMCGVISQGSSGSFIYFEF